MVQERPGLQAPVVSDSQSVTMARNVATAISRWHTMLHDSYIETWIFIVGFLNLVIKLYIYICIWNTIFAKNKQRENIALINILMEKS